MIDAWPGGQGARMQYAHRREELVRVRDVGVFWVRLLGCCGRKDFASFLGHATHQFARFFRKSLTRAGRVQGSHARMYPGNDSQPPVHRRSLGRWRRGMPRSHVYLPERTTRAAMQGAPCPVASHAAASERTCTPSHSSRTCGSAAREIKTDAGTPAPISATSGSNREP